MADATPHVVLRRAISLDRRDESTIVAWLEDDFHHFGVTLRHDGACVIGISATAVRYPWTTCTHARAPLQQLVGAPLLARASDLARHAEMRLHCTHMFELAALAMARASRDAPDTLYEAEIVLLSGERPWDRGCVLAARLYDNGISTLDWEVSNNVIKAPASCAGQSLIQGFRVWLEALDPWQVERAWVLRRAAWLAQGDRRFARSKSAGNTNIGAVCYTYQPERRYVATAMQHSIRDFTPGSPPLLARRSEQP